MKVSGSVGFVGDGGVTSAPPKWSPTDALCWFGQAKPYQGLSRVALALLCKHLSCVQTGAVKSPPTVYLHRPPLGMEDSESGCCQPRFSEANKDVTTQAVWAFGTLSCCTHSWPAGRGKAITQPLHILLGSALARSYGHCIHKLSRYRTSGQSPPA